MNNFMIDPMIGQQLLNMSADSNFIDPNVGYNPIQNMLIDNP